MGALTDPSLPCKLRLLRIETIFFHLSLLFSFLRRIACVYEFEGSLGGKNEDNYEEAMGFCACAAQEFKHSNGKSDSTCCLARFCPLLSVLHDGLTRGGVRFLTPVGR